MTFQAQRQPLGGRMMSEILVSPRKRMTNEL